MSNVDTFYGPSLVMMFGKTPSRPRLIQMYQQALIRERMHAGEYEAWANPATLERMAKGLEAGDQAGMVDLYLDRIPKEGEGISMRDALHFDFWAQSFARFEPANAVFLAVRVAKVPFDPVNATQLNLVLGIFKNIVRVLEPDFAAIDNWWERFAKRKGKDLRMFAWGAMHYGPALVKEVGRQEIDACAALGKEEWPGGGMWIQMWDNPFIVSNELLRQVEKELALRERFPVTARPRPASVKT